MVAQTPQPAVVKLGECTGGVGIERKFSDRAETGGLRLLLPSGPPIQRRARGGDDKRDQKIREDLCSEFGVGRLPHKRVPVIRRRKDASDHGGNQSVSPHHFDREDVS